MSAPRVVRNALGEPREVKSAWPDGAYTCPFCAAAVAPDAEHCPNPACEAGGASVEQVRERRQRRTERERRQREERDRWDRFAEMQRRDREQREREVAQAREAGYCERCFVRSGHRRRVRHRRADYHETS